ncbi:hypothetical protein Golob_021853, partial [Gossypium lobatum]|nr:hypothetical protein [Gossypium lobatum]
QSQFKGLAKDNDGFESAISFLEKEKGSFAGLRIDLEKQLQAWRENPSWVNEPPEIKVSVPKGSLCNLKAKLDVGLPPDAVYDILTDPDSTISVRVLVDQNREDHSLLLILMMASKQMKFEQVNTGFMKKFEGQWRIEPIFVDEETCFPFKPKTLAEYCSCSGGKGRIGSKVSLDQLVQPAIVPPPPISWYLRGITAKTTEMLIHDLVAEADRLTGGRRSDSKTSSKEFRLSKELNEYDPVEQIFNIKQRWSLHRRNAKQHRKKLLNV